MLRRRGTAADLLVVGLGNPGDEYARTRHNVGAEVVELLAKRHGAHAEEGQGARPRRPGAHRSVAASRSAIPLTYMNDSGLAVAALVRRYGVEPEQLVVVQDELDLPVGALKVKNGGGLAGHNGLRSIKAHLHSDAFLRVRIGVGKPVSKEHGADHVLKKFSKRERAEIDVVLEEAADAVELIVADGVDAAMNRVN